MEIFQYSGRCADRYSVHAQHQLAQVAQFQVLDVVVSLPAVDSKAVLLPAVDFKVDPAQLLATSAEDQITLLETARLKL